MGRRRDARGTAPTYTAFERAKVKQLFAILFAIVVDLVWEEVVGEGREGFRAKANSCDPWLSFLVGRTRLSVDLVVRLELCL